MKTRAILLLTALSLGIFSFHAAADETEYNPIVTSVPSLGIAPDATATGMGDAAVGTTPTTTSQFWNPSKYAQMESSAGFSLSFTPWLRKLVSDIDLASIYGYGKIGDKQAISASLRYFSLGDVIVRESLGDVGYSVRPYEFAVDAGYSRMLGRYYSMSVALRFIYSDLMSGDDPAGKSFAADISGYYKKPLMLGRNEGFWSFGFNASNIGTKISYDSGNNYYFIPANLRIGGAVKLPFNAFNALSVALDFDKLMVPTPVTREQYEFQDISSIEGIFRSFTDAPGGFKEELREINISFGLEYAYNDMFFARTGYHYESEYKGNRKYFTFGAGFKMSMFNIDISYLVSQSQSNPLDQTLRFTLGFDIDGLKKLFNK